MGYLGDTRNEKFPPAWLAAIPSLALRVREAWDRWHYRTLNVPT